VLASRVSPALIIVFPSREGSLFLESPLSPCTPSLADLALEALKLPHLPLDLAGEFTRDEDTRLHPFVEEMPIVPMDLIVDSVRDCGALIPSPEWIGVRIDYG